MDTSDLVTLHVISIKECNIKWNNDDDRKSFNMLLKDSLLTQRKGIYLPTLKIFDNKLYNYTLTVEEDRGLIDLLYITIPVYFWTSTHDGSYLLHADLKLMCEFNEPITVEGFNTSKELMKTIIHKSIQENFFEYGGSFHKFLYDLSSSFKYYSCVLHEV